MKQRESVRLIRAALVRKGYQPIRAVRTSKSPNSDILTWYTRIEQNIVRVVVLQEYEDGTQGCDLFIQATTSNSTEKTIEAIP